MARVSITEHPARSGLQDKDVLTGTLVSVNDEEAAPCLCVVGGCVFYLLHPKCSTSKARTFLVGDDVFFTSDCLSVQTW